MPEAGQRQLGGARAATDGVLCLEDDDAAAGLGERDGGGEPIGARPDDDGG